MSDIENGPVAIKLAAGMYAGLASIGRDPSFQQVLSEDPYLFASYMAAINPVLAAVLEQSTLTPHRKLKGELAYGQSEKISQTAINALDERNEALKMINELKNHLGAQLTAGYASIFIRYTEVHKHASANQPDKVRAPSEIIKAASAIVLEAADDDGTATFTHNLNMLSGLLGLNKTESNLITIATLQSVDAAANIFFRYIQHSIPGRSDLLDLMAIAVLFDHDVVFRGKGTIIDGVAAAQRALDIQQSKPLAFGMATYSPSMHRFGNISNFWLQILFTEFSDIGELCETILIEAKPKTSASGALARIDDKDKELIDKLITTIKAEPKKAGGTNLLCYGSSRFDKRSVLLESLKDKADGIFELRTRGVAPSDMPSIAWVALERLRDMKEATNKTFILLIDQAENVLSQSNRRSSLMYDLFGEDVGTTKDKKEDRTNLDSDEHLLTEGTTLTFWMTDRISRLAVDAVGRFLAHIEIKGGTRADRKAEVVKIAAELKLGDDMVQALSKYTELGSNQVRSAATLVKILEEEGEVATKRILTTVEASQKALGRDGREEIRESVTKYDLSLLNLSGKFGIEKIVQALKKRPTATMCFYGLPGTGKTQLAEHLALAIDKPLLVKRASDIFNMYLGESEKKVKEMFEEGLSEDAIILLDEADSFMRDRKLAKQSWEVSIVNELLTRMERFPGVFICATNLFEQLDAAAMRRFTFKLQFHSLSEAQRRKMFHNETGVDVDDIDHPLYEQLQGVKFLTPGDFATVKRQANLLGEELTPEDWLEQLAEEAKAKLQGIQSMGLSQEDAFLLEQAQKKPK